MASTDNRGFSKVGILIGLQDGQDIPGRVDLQTDELLEGKAGGSNAVVAVLRTVWMGTGLGDRAVRPPPLQSYRL